MNSTAPLSRVGQVALHYGFVPIETARLGKEDREYVRTLKEEPCACLPSVYAEDKVALLRRYEEERLDRAPEPALFYRETRAANGALTAHLDILGCAKSIAEALVIKTALTALHEAGEAAVRVRINSVGDRDSLARFWRELHGFYRKRADALHASCRDALKEDDAFSALACEHEACRTLRADAPKPLGFLSDVSRGHFKKVLEYLERLEVPYELQGHLVGHHSICTQTIFDVWNESGALLASGFRYNHLARRLGTRRDIPALGATLIIRTPAAPSRVRPTERHFYFIQLGEQAKVQGLQVIERLRRAELFVLQSLTSDTLGSQIAHAESLGVPYFIIVGQKEAVDGTALVRDRERRFQETVPLEKLAVFLKRLIA